MHRSSPSNAPSELFLALLRHRGVLTQLIRREVTGRYRGSMVGLAWTFFNPLIMLTVYTTVFSGIFKARWPGAEVDSPTDFALLLFAGMIAHGVLAECLARAPAQIVGNANLVKKVIFPIEILPCVSVGAAFFHGLMSLAVLMLANALINHHLPMTVLALPLILLPLMFFALGGSWFLAATGVYLRDIEQVIGSAMTVLMFLSPVFYPVSALPDAMQPWMQANPMTLLIESLRQVIVLGLWPDIPALLRHTALATACAWLGFWWFQRTRLGFADVL